MRDRAPDTPIYYTTLRTLSDQDLREALAGPPEQAAKWVYAAATGGSPAAQVTLGQMLLDGHGLKRDAKAAFRWFGIAASSGDLDGLNMLGRCHQLGWGTAVDFAKATDCYRKAAAKSHVWAQYNLAMRLLHDSGQPGDVLTALTLLIRAARRGNPKAMNMLGRYCEFGWVGPVKTDSATRWYRRAAVRGCFRGAAHLARILDERGEAAAADHWYRRSAETATVMFCRELAARLFGHARSVRHAIARTALERATASEEAADLFAFGHALAKGLGGPVDRAAAAIWLGRAQAKGFPGALALLDQLDSL